MDADDAKLVADLQEYGWHMITMSEDDQGPGSTVMIALHHSYGHPEVIVFGLPDNVMQGIADCIEGLLPSRAGTRTRRPSVSTTSIASGIGAAPLATASISRTC